MGRVDILIGLTYGCDVVDGLENITIEEGESMTNAFCKASIEYPEAIKPFFSKTEMIEKVDIYNSVTYLESQVDILTRMMLKLYNENDELKSLLSEADRYSVLDIKSHDSILREIADDKKNIRELQKEYYDKKKK